MTDLEHESSLQASDVPLPGGDFRLLVQKLAYQALISLGVLDNPLTGGRTTNVEQARSVIDDIRMLVEKTEGNLTPEEDEHLTTVLAQLDKHLQAHSSGGTAAADAREADTEP